MDFTEKRLWDKEFYVKVYWGVILIDTQVKKWVGEERGKLTHNAIEPETSAEPMVRSVAGTTL